MFLGFLKAIDWNCLLDAGEKIDSSLLQCSLNVAAWPEINHAFRFRAVNTDTDEVYQIHYQETSF